MPDSMEDMIRERRQSPNEGRDMPAHIRSSSKQARSDTAHTKWENEENRIIKILAEEFGLVPFTAEEALDARDDITPHSITVKAMLQRLKKRGWLEKEGDEYAINSTGYNFAENN